MLKTVLVVLAASFGTTAALFLAPPRIFYSGFQWQIPFRTALKVTPDGSNVWSWRHQFTEDGVQELIVDFDRNGRMDTENEHARVLVTDMSVTFPGLGGPKRASTTNFVQIEDDEGVLWDMLPIDSARFTNRSWHLVTPLVFPVRSRIKVRCTGLALPEAPVFISLQGRLVSL